MIIIEVEFKQEAENLIVRLVNGCMKRCHALNVLNSEYLHCLIIQESKEVLGWRVIQKLMCFFDLFNEEHFHKLQLASPDGQVQGCVAHTVFIGHIEAFDFLKQVETSF